MRGIRFDREHALAFARFLWKRFRADKCFETAGALSYTTLFALVPLLAAVIGILSAFPVFNAWTRELTDFIFRNFVPATGSTVRDYLLAFAGNASKMTALGIIVLLATALMMMSAIEDRLNRIWRVERRRSSVARFLVYWAALTLGPIFAVGGLALSSYLFALPAINHAAAAVSGLRDVLLRGLPFLLTLAAMLFLYVLVPNRRVAWRHAFVGALLAAILFEFAKWGFALYVSRVPSYQQLYGAVAVVPIFLIWIYLSWVIVLLGASIAASLSSFDYRPRSERLPRGAAFLGALHVVKAFVVAQREGRALQATELRRSERFLSDDLVQRVLADLRAAGLIEETESHGWMLATSVEAAGLERLYEVGGYRIPLDSAADARWNEGLPAPLAAALDALRARIAADLGQPLAKLYPPSNPKPDEKK